MGQRKPLRVGGAFGLVVAPFLLMTSSALLVDAGETQGRIDFKAADTSSPRTTLETFIDACNELHHLVTTDKYFDRTSGDHAALASRILDCIDADKLPAFARQDRAAEVAACLKEILDREEIPPWDEIPDEKAIEAAGGFEKLPHWRIPGTRITIARVEEGARRHEYLFSPGTVDRAVEYFKQIEAKPYRTDKPEVSKDLYRWYMSAPGHPALGEIVSRLPDWARYGRMYGLATWKWPGILVALITGIALIVAAYRLQAYTTRRWKKKSLTLYWVTLLFPIAAMLVPLIFKYVAQDYLTVRGDPLYIVSFCSIFVMLLAGLILIFAASNRIAESIIASPRINPHGLNAQLIRIVSKLLSLVAVVTLFLIGGQYLGIPIATLLASAGIGGLAVAFGAQDSLRTLFGTLMLMADKPFRVGERIIFNKYDGVVEDIGLRSTRIRLLTGHQVTVPNGELARSDIENVGRRPHIRRNAEIRIPLDTPCDKVEQAVAIIRKKLDNHEGMTPDYPPRVFFDEFCSNAFSIRFSYWYSPPNHWDFKAFNEKLNFEIFREFEEQGIQFSLPLRHSYWKRDDRQGPLDVCISTDSQPNTGKHQAHF